MKFFPASKTPALTSKLTLIVLALLLIAIGITIGDTVSQKNLRTNADNGQIFATPASSSSTMNQPSIVSVPSDKIENDQENEFGENVLEFLKKFVGALR